MTDYLQRPLDITQRRVASVLDEMSYWAARFAALIFENLELRRGIRALDLGCGTGCPLFELAHIHGESCQFVGLDIWQAGLERAARKLDVYGLQHVSLVEGSGDNLPFGDGTFDLIVGNVLLNNLARPDVALAECYRVMQPGARLVMTTNLVGHFRELYSIYRAVLADFDTPAYLKRLDVNEVHRGTKAAHVATIEAAGFTMTRLIEDTLVLRFLDGSALLRHALVRVGFLDGWRAVVPKTAEAAVFEALESRLNIMAERDGELRMTVPMLYLEAER